MTMEWAEDAIRVASLALPPPQRAAFCPMVTSQLASLLCTLGPGSLHRVIAACQKTFLDAGAVAVGPSPKPGKLYATPARVKQSREA
jgi:hypothetical protein